MSNPLVRKLETVCELSVEDKEVLLDFSQDVHEIAADRHIIREGQRADYVHLIVSGWAARYKLLPSGKRQITAFLVPGDFCDLQVTLLRQMDHSIQTLTAAELVRIPANAVKELPFKRPALTRALWWSTLVDEAVLREWLVSAGRRNAYEAVAHLLCELHARLRRVGLVQDQRYELGPTQEELADALGLTSVHVNRTLQRLRREGLIGLFEREVTILDSPGLCKVAGFDPTYLHTESFRQPPSGLATRSESSGCQLMPLRTDL